MLRSLLAHVYGVCYRIRSWLSVGRWRDAPSTWGLHLGVGLLIFAVLADPVVAASVGENFCNTALAETLRNIFTLIQFGGPLIGGVVALGATVGLSIARQADRRYELKELRNQGLVWGVVVTPLGSIIIQFILNNVVAGGASCAF